MLVPDCLGPPLIFGIAKERRFVMDKTSKALFASLVIIILTMVALSICFES